MEHRPGHLHGNADGLSHLTGEGATLEEQGEVDAMLIQSVNVEPLSNECIKATQKQDPVLSQVVDWLQLLEAGNLLSDAGSTARSSNQESTVPVRWQAL